MIQLNYRDSRPIYEQIKESLTRLMIQGILKEDDKLPSVRELASELTINPNTIQRAYRELEADGYIYSMPGKGSFVAKLPDTISKRKDALFEQFDRVTAELLLLNTSIDEMTSHIEHLAKGGDTK